MSELTTVRVATTPMHAKLIVALLQSEGIPASVEGELLDDQFAVSQRLLNAAGTEVKVPTADIERAREVLAAAAEAVDDAELEAQALAAAPTERDLEARQRRSPPMAHWPFVMLGMVIGGIGVWILRDAAQPSHADPFWQIAPIANGFREQWRHNPGYFNDLIDRNDDGFFERVVANGPDGTSMTTEDTDGDGRYDLVTERTPDGHEVRWTRRAGAVRFDEATVTDPAGEVLQRLRWVAGRGFQLDPR